MSEKEKIMSKKEKMPITPKVLKWVREKTNYKVKDLLIKFPNYEKWESGKGYPNYRELSELSDLFNITDVVFFLPKPPGKEYMTSGIEPKLFFKKYIKDDIIKKLTPDFLKLVMKASYISSVIIENFTENDFCLKSNVFDNTSNKNNIIETIPFNFNNEKKTKNEISNQVFNDERNRNLIKDLENKNIFVFREPFIDNKIAGFSLLIKHSTNFGIIIVNSNNTTSRQTYSLLFNYSNLIKGVNGIDMTNPKKNNIYKDKLFLFKNNIDIDFFIKSEKIKKKNICFSCEKKGITHLSKKYIDLIFELYLNNKIDRNDFMDFLFIKNIYSFERIKNIYYQNNEVFYYNDKIKNYS